MKRALIVEDREYIRKLLKACVGNAAGIDVIDDVMSGEEALDIFEPGKYNLVVIDIALVELNGVEVAIEMRQQDKDVVLVAISGYTSLEGCNLKLAGFDDYFFKGDGYRDFLKFVEKNCK